MALARWRIFSMITIENGDLFDVKEGIICHQVNCQGAMGRGVAAQFKKRFPHHFLLYKQMCATTKPIGLLGRLLINEEEPNLYSCSMFAQLNWRGDGCKTDYAAFRSCCYDLKEYMKNKNINLSIYMPLHIGCGLAGGDWDTVYNILKDEFQNYNLILRRYDK